MLGGEDAKLLRQLLDPLKLVGLFIGQTACGAPQCGFALFLAGEMEPVNVVGSLSNRSVGSVFGSSTMSSSLAIACRLPWLPGTQVTTYANNIGGLKNVGVFAPVTKVHSALVFRFGQSGGSRRLWCRMLSL